MKATLLSFLAMIAVCIAGCRAPRVSEKDVARIARDWCITIRASQVIPTYPLTEDILPGDVFLVRRPIQQEQREYDERGFLPLPQHVVRIHPSGVEDFYLSSHGTRNQTDPPYFWRFGSPVAGSNDVLHLMPRAAFPSYSFTTRRGGGLNLAVPIQGIPVAMNLVGSSRVEGTVLLKDAYTYGFDQASLQRQLLAWATNNPAFLATLAPVDGATNYLRMISRVYLLGRVNVQVNAAASFAGSASGGAEKPVNLPSLSGTNTIENYTNGVNALSSSLSSALNAPGGTLKLASASSRSVVLDETFPRPLVVGYLGFDVPVLPGGKLGLPQDSWQRLQGLAQAQSTNELTYVYSADANTTALREWLRADPRRIEAAKQWLSTNAAPNLANVLTAAEFADLRRRMMETLVNKP